jgi:hypothetical protein
MLASINPGSGEDARTTAGQETGGTGFNAISRAGPSITINAKHPPISAQDDDFFDAKFRLSTPG